MTVTPVLPRACRRVVTACDASLDQLLVRAVSDAAPIQEGASPQVDSCRGVLLQPSMIAGSTPPSYFAWTLTLSGAYRAEHAGTTGEQALPPRDSWTHVPCAAPGGRHILVMRLSALFRLRRDLWITSALTSRVKVRILITTATATATATATPANTVQGAGFGGTHGQ